MSLEALRDSGELRREWILAYIESYWLANWTSPSVREVMAAAGLESPATVAYHLERLVDDGRLGCDLRCHR